MVNMHDKKKFVSEMELQAKSLLQSYVSFLAL